ncbi:39S ribosomal protein L10, mitochondrial isoform X1 [Nilaparvata lugens]|uniref:39S ribosomal protein L10, mitochondrial isoform X1 n=1 Tax=Nilaparvata lugens TaxID=108931 RepID=UPI00193E4EDA|nr:39S ribosomal protein L10, mitochondrial isoform X1 [Nilaparvata lugens]
MFEKEEDLHTKIRFKREGMILKNSSKHLLKLAIGNSKYEPILQLFTFHQTIIFSPEPKVDVLFKLLKKTPKLILMAGIVDGYLASVKHLNDWCRLRDLETARSELVSVLNIGAQRIVADLSQQQRMLVGQLDQHVAINADKASAEGQQTGDHATQQSEAGDTQTEAVQTESQPNEAGKSAETENQQTSEAGKPAQSESQQSEAEKTAQASSESTDPTNKTPGDT